MRTTVNLREEALELCKRKAKERGMPLGEVISEAVLAVYRDQPRSAKSANYDLPVSGYGGLQPGIHLDNTVLLEDFMEGRG